MLQFKDKIRTLKRSGKLPTVLLITGLKSDEALEQLELIAQELENKTVTEAKGNKLILGSEPGVSIKVDDVRDLLKKMSLRNWEEGAARYILVPHAEMLTVQSSNALLKSLEEAPEKTHFLLASPSKSGLLKTIVSRSFTIYFPDHSEKIKTDKTSAFEAAFLSKNFGPLENTSRSDLKEDWDLFSSRVKNAFFEKVYSGELDSAEWYRLFDFMSEIEQKIGAHSDPKWLVSSIERFGFDG